MPGVSYDKLTPPAKGDYFKFPDGESCIKIVSLPYELTQHFVQGDRSYACLGAEGGCKFCLAGAEPETKFLYRIIDRADGKLKVAEVGWSIVGAIKDFRDSNEYGFDTDCPPWDVIVTRTGQGLKTRYTVHASRKDTPLTKAEQKLIDEAGDLDELVTKKRERAVDGDPGRHETGAVDPDQSEREKEEIASSRKRKPGIGTTKPQYGDGPVEAMKEWKAKIAAAATVKELDEAESQTIFDKRVTPALDAIIRDAIKGRKAELALEAEG